MKVKCLVAQSCPTLRNPMDCSPPGSSVHRILLSRILEWVVISFSRDLLSPFFNIYLGDSGLIPAVWETWFRSSHWDDPLKKGMATHSSILVQRINLLF